MRCAKNTRKPKEIYKKTAAAAVFFASRELYFGRVFLTVTDLPVCVEEVRQVWKTANELV